MIKETYYTFTFDVCCMNIFPGNGDIHFHDYDTNETIVLEGRSKDDLHGAIKRYVHNLGVNGKNKEWLEEMQAEISASLVLLEVATDF